MCDGDRPGGNRIASAGATIAGGFGGATGGIEGATTDGGVCPLAPDPALGVGALGVGVLGVGKLQIRCRYEPHGCEAPDPTQVEIVQLTFTLVVTEPDTVDEVVGLEVELDPECAVQNVCGGGVLECGPDGVVGPEVGPELVDGA